MVADSRGLLKGLHQGQSRWRKNAFVQNFTAWLDRGGLPSGELLWQLVAAGLFLVCCLLLVTRQTPSIIEDTPYSYVMALSNHKTGTFMLRCLSNAISISLLHMPNKLFFKQGFSINLTDAHASIPTFPGRPPMLPADHAVPQTCYGRRMSPERFRCPNPLVPCNPDGSPLLQLGGCYIDLPASDQGAPGFIHFYRNPWDIVTSAYWYHTQDPPPEQWLLKDFAVIADEMTEAGVPASALEHLGLGEEHRSIPYSDLLRSLPEEQGIQLQFWQSAPDMYAMGRQYRLLEKHPGALQTRFEDANSDFAAALMPILYKFYPQYIGPILYRVDKLHCDPNSWDVEALSSSNHITSAKRPPGVKERLQRVLWESEKIRKHLCSLARAMHYDDKKGLPCKSKAS